MRGRGQYLPKIKDSFFFLFVCLFVCFSILGMFQAATAIAIKSKKKKVAFFLFSFLRSAIYSKGSDQHKWTRSP